MQAKSLLQMSGVIVDLIYRVQSVPTAGQEANVQSCVITAGGGFNAMVAAKRSGMQVSYGGAHGTGLLSEFVRNAMADEKFVMLQKQSSFADQGNCVVLVDDAGERTFISKEGADGILNASLLSEVKAMDFDWLLLSGYALSFKKGQKALGDWINGLPKGGNFVFDPSPVVSRIPAPLLESTMATATWISANAEEAAFITKSNRPEKAVVILTKQYGSNTEGAVVRCGADGCWIALRGQEAVYVPGFKVDTIDTNGAGDAHLGNFIAALSQGTHPVEAASFANAAAALSTTVKGSATAPNQQETDAFLQRA